MESAVDVCPRPGNLRLDVPDDDEAVGPESDAEISGARCTCDLRVTDDRERDRLGRNVGGDGQHEQDRGAQLPRGDLRRRTVKRATSARPHDGGPPGVEDAAHLR